MKLLPVILLVLLLACHNVENNGKSNSSPVADSVTEKEGTKDLSIVYDLSKPSKKWVLPDELKEISGNAWIDEDHLLVIEDLHPNLYVIKLEREAARIEKIVPFETSSDKKFDIEDVAIAGKDAYALWSHGFVFKIANWQGNAKTTEIPTFLNKKNNTEGITYDPVSGNLLIACKNKSGLEDEKKSTRAVYALDLKSDKINEEPAILLKKKQFKEESGEKLDFNPSAISIQPKSHDIYILSTKGTKAMAVYDHNGELKSVVPIDEDMMPQPEGLCFSPEGELFISTEGKHGVPARLYRFEPASK
ncbi:MAG: SdiA-regulated domain-containing protein [Flavisolibacter sp.]